MAQHHISAAALIEAPPQDVYAIIADYHHGHTEIVPRPPFVSIDVEQGGVGSGTVIRVGIRVLGLRQTYRAVITEPDPGRVLLETNDTGHATSFTVEPRADGRHAFVTITTVLSRSGPLGALERWYFARFLPPVFARELELLAAVAARQAAPASAATTPSR